MNSKILQKSIWLLDLLVTIVAVIAGLKSGMADNVTQLLAILTFAFSLNIHHGLLFGRDIVMGGFSVTLKEKALRFFFFLVSLGAWYAAFLSLHHGKN